MAYFLLINFFTFRYMHRSHLRLIALTICRCK